MLIPSRLYCTSFATKIRENPLVRSRRPRRYTFSNSRPFFSRWERGRAREAALLTLCRQSLAALCPSAVDDGTAGPGPHAFAKTMGAFPFDFAWLICSLHFFFLNFLSKIIKFCHCLSGPTTFFGILFPGGSRRWSVASGLPFSEWKSLMRKSFILTTGLWVCQIIST